MASRRNPKLADLPPLAQVRLDQAMELGVRFDGLIGVLQRAATPGSPTNMLDAWYDAERWFWNRGLTWNYTELTTKQDAAWARVWQALQTELDATMLIAPKPEENYTSDAITTLLVTLLNNGGEDGQATTDFRQDGAARFTGPFDPQELATSYPEDMAALDYEDREYLRQAKGALLTWDDQGFYEGYLWFSAKAYGDAWAEREREFAEPNFMVILETNDGEGDTVTAHVEGDGAAEWAHNDQTIDGQRWEIENEDFAYAILINRPELPRYLREELGYDVNDDAWSPPD